MPDMDRALAELNPTKEMVDEHINDLGSKVTAAEAAASSPSRVATRREAEDVLAETQEYA